MYHGSGEARRAERLTELVTAQLSAVCLASCTRDLCRADLELPVAPGEISLHGRFNVLLVRNLLLLRRGFKASGMWVGEGRERQPVYSRPD